VIGAGTVLNQEPNCSIDAGAQFLVGPGFDERTLRLASARSTPSIPGALTPTEIMAARAAGADIIKVFPCGTVGGAKYIKALKGPFLDVPLIPTGGVNLETAAGFVEAGAFALGVGGELISAPALESGNVHEITETARKFVEVVRAARARSGAKVNSEPQAG
jgi:2-dehydro-3-deoxyphosphogluconate aldolase/(4S)-4-hydroxy-2-oxoglutarate aldolase